MKSIKTISIFALAAFAFAGCQTELELTPASPIKIGEEITITAASELGTKTVLQENNAIFWNDGDAIDILYGKAKGTFTTTLDAPAQVAAFTGTLNTVLGGTEGNQAEPQLVYGVYPSAEGVIMGKDYKDDPVVVTPFKYLQTAVDGSFDPEAFIAVASSENLNLSFNNVLSLLALTVNYEDVTSITVENIDKSLGGIGAGIINVSAPLNEKPSVVGADEQTHFVKLSGSFVAGHTYYMAVLPGTYAKGVTFTIRRGEDDPDPIVKTIDASVTAERNKVHEVVLGEAKPKELTLKTLWLKQSGETAWNTYFGGTGGTDRNIAMDDEYVYIAESAATAKLWAISIADPSDVTAVNVEGVAGGGAHVLTCPRVIKNTDANVNGGKDVLICCSLTRGDADPKLYIWNNGIDSAPKAVTLTTWATAAWYGDTFTVFGTLQDGVLFFDKTGSGDANNGIVTFLLKGVPAGDEMFLQARLTFNDAMGSHKGVCAYYPYPDNINTGVYSPGRGTEARGKNVVATGNIKGEGAITVALDNLDYDEGTNGYVLGYNFIEWEGKRYVIYGNQSSNKVGYIRVRQGALDTPWATIASTGERLYRRDLMGEEGCALTSGNSAMDIAARVIDGDLYFVGQKQNIACGLYKLCYE